MENSDIDVLIGMLEDGIDAGYDEYDDIIYYNFKREYESSNEIKSLLDKIEVKYRKEFDDDLDEFDLSDENLIIDYGEEQKIKDWLKSNKKQLMEYLKTKDKKTIGRFALIFGEALDEDLLKEIINSYNIEQDEFYNYDEYDKFGLDRYQRGKILTFIKDSEYLKYALKNSEDLNINIDNFVYVHILKSINDVSQIKSYIEKAESHNNYGIAELVISLNEPDYTKKIIEEREKYGLDEIAILELLKNLNDHEFIKQIIENTEQYAIDSYGIVELLKYLNDHKYIKQVIESREQYGVNDANIVELLKYLKDHKYIKQVIENAEKYAIDGHYIVQLLEYLNNPEYIKQIIDSEDQHAIDGHDIVELLKYINEPEYTKRVIENREQYGLDVGNILELLKSLNNPEYIKQVIENREQYGVNGNDIVELLRYLKDPVYIKKIIEARQQYGLDYNNILNIIPYLDDIEYSKKIIKEIIENREQYGINNREIVWQIKNLNDLEYTKTIIENRERYGLDEYDVIEVLKSFKYNTDFIKDCIKNRKKFNLSGLEKKLFGLAIEIMNKDTLKEIIINRKEYELSAEDLKDLAFENFSGEELLEFIDKEVSEIYRNKYASSEFIKENLSRFLEIEGVSTIKDVLFQMSEKNEEIFKGNFDILNERYINILGVEKVNQISCYFDIANIVLGLNDGELKLLGKVLDKYMDMTKGEEWTPLAKKILENIGSYKELVSNLEENENISIDKLIPILIHSNNFDIKTLEDVENFQEIKRKKCEELINGETLEEKQKAVLLKVFGQGMRETKKIISRFEEDIDEIEDEDLKAYIKSLQEILKIENPEVLKEIFEQVEELETINPLLMERMLKTEYCKLYNGDLFNLKNAEKLPDGENVYNAGTDFKMIITSVGAFYTNNSVIDYKKDWNKPKIGSQHFCASYIRNDMLGHAPVPHICYGFCEMAEDSLMLSGSMDLASSGVSFESTARRNERYLAPNNQIAKTIRYNEMDFRRIQKGKKKQPDYIVVFRKHGKIPNIDKAKKASKDFEGLPIVVIDVDECLASERKKAEEMFEEYKKTSNPQVGIKLLEKLRNNRVTDYDFCRDTDMDKTLQSLKEQKSRKEANVSMKDLEEIYGEVSGKERQEETGKIRMVYERIRMIKGRKDNSDGR